MNKQKNKMVFNVPFITNDLTNGCVIDTNGLEKHGGTISIRFQEKGISKYNPLRLVYKFIDGSFDTYHKPIDRFLLANEKQYIRDVLDVHQIQTIKEIVNNKQKIVELMKDESFVEMSEYDKFGYQILYNMYHEYLHVDEDNSPLIDTIGTMYLSKIPNEYFELILELMDGSSVSHLVIQSVLYKIELIIRNNKNLPDEIQFSVVGICSPNNDSYISFDNFVKDPTLFGGKSILDVIDFTELKNDLDVERAEKEMEIMTNNIEEVGGDIGIKKGDTLKDVFTKYTIGASLYNNVKDEEINDVQPNKITLSDNVANNKEVKQKVDKTFEQELDDLIGQL